MNQCTFAGRAGSEAQIRKTNGDQSVASFSLAVDRFKKDAGPLWVKVTLWGKTADGVARFVTKGKQLVVSGEVDLNSYQTKDGETRTEITLNAARVTLMGGGEEHKSEEDQVFGN